MDEGARAVMAALEEAGFEAYAVGGCVRDLLMGRVPHDWDITTSAAPEEILSVLSGKGWKAVDVGGKSFGVIVAVLGRSSYEIATFRTEVYGADSHRPEKVHFTGSLREDLARRDFTVNAMALDRDGVVYDYFGGERDLQKKILRTVGDPAERFSEDALRLFRACRFLGTLDFMADPSLVHAMKGAFPRVAGLSAERVRQEVNRLLMSDHPGRGLDLLVRSGLGECSCRIRENGADRPMAILPELSHLVDLPQMKEYHKYDAWYHTLAVVEATPKELILRWAALLHDVGKGLPGVRHVEGEVITDYGHDREGARLADALLTRWEMPSWFRRRVVWLVENHMKFHYYANCEDADVGRWVRRLAAEKAFPTQKELVEAIREETLLCKADIIGCGRPLSATDGHEAFGRCMMDLARVMPVTTKDLSYDRRTIDALGPLVGEGMENLLRRVQNGALPNEADALFAAAERFRKRRS